MGEGDHMKVGDLVKYGSYPSNVSVGIVVGFDEDNDPIIWQTDTGVVIAHWYNKVKVISESR